MKVLYSRTNFWFGLKSGGSIGHTAGVLNGLSKLSDVHILSNEPSYSVSGIPCQIVRPFGTGRLGEVIYNFYYAPKLAAKIMSFLPDFVYHRYTGYSFATAFICQRLNVPLVLEFNSSELWKLRYWMKPEDLKSRLAYPIKKALLSFTEPFNLRAASLIVVVAAPLKEELISSGIPGNRILVNPNAVDTEKFKPLSKNLTLPLKLQLGIHKDKIVVGFSGTFGIWHGVPELSDAISRLNSEPYWRDRLFFVLYGEGEFRPEIKAKVGHFKNVCFTGAIDFKKIQDYLAICDILVSPHGKTKDGRSFFGSPTKLFEYMSMEKGIVASKLGQIGDVLKHKETAYLVEPGNVDELVEGIVYLAENPNERLNWGRAARKAVQEKHTWNQNAANVILAFNKIFFDGAN